MKRKAKRIMWMPHTSWSEPDPDGSGVLVYFYPYTGWVDVNVYPELRKYCISPHQYKVRRLLGTL